MLEVSGSEEKEYLDRKYRQHTNMANFGPLFSFPAAELARKGTLDEGLRELVRQLSAFLLKK